MKKFILISIVGMFVAISANAQLFEYGLKAGVTFASLPMEEISGIVSDPTDLTSTYSLLTGESSKGYQAGIMTRVNIAMFFIQPEVYFNVSKATVQQVYDNGPTEMLDVKFQRFDIPLLVGVKVGPLRLKAGPVGTAVINSTGELFDVVSQDLQTISDGLSWGFQAGVSVDLLKKLAIEARYEGSLSKYADTFEVSDMSFDFDSRPRQFILSAGWWF